MPALKQIQTDSDYHKQTALNDIKKLNSQLKELPGFCRDFFRGIEQTTTTKTRIGYASDLRTFFRFLFSTNPEFSGDNNEKKKTKTICKNILIISCFTSMFYWNKYVNQ